MWISGYKECYEALTLKPTANPHMACFILLDLYIVWATENNKSEQVPWRKSKSLCVKKAKYSGTIEW